MDEASCCNQRYFSLPQTLPAEKDGKNEACSEDKKHPEMAAMKMKACIYAEKLSFDLGIIAQKQNSHIF